MDVGLTNEEIPSLIDVPTSKFALFVSVLSDHVPDSLSTFLDHDPALLVWSHIPEELDWINPINILVTTEIRVRANERMVVFPYWLPSSIDKKILTWK